MCLKIRCDRYYRKKLETKQGLTNAHQKDRPQCCTSHVMWGLGGLGEEYSPASLIPACGEAARTQVSWHQWDGFRPCLGPWYAEARCVKAVSGCSLASLVFPARSSFPRLSCCTRQWNARPPQTVWRDFFAFFAQTHRKRCPKQGLTNAHHSH